MWLMEETVNINNIQLRIIKPSSLLLLGQISTLNSVLPCDDNDPNLPLQKMVFEPSK